MEMIVCILFFSLSAAVSAQMFAKSHMISQTAINENHAVIEVNNMAEAFYAEHGDLGSISHKLYGDETLLAHSMLGVYFDKDFCIVSALGEVASYQAQLVLNDPDNTQSRSGTITFYEFESDGVKEIYSLDVVVDIPHTYPAENN